MPDRLPIRWRLTLWYAGLLGATLAVFGVGLYLAPRLRLYDTFDAQLRVQAALTLATIRVEGGQPLLDPNATGSVPDQDEFVFRLIASDGRVIADSGPPLGSRPLGVEVLEAGWRGETRLTSFRVDGNLIRVVTAPVRSEQGVAGGLQVGLSRDDTDDVLREVLLALVIAAPPALLAAGGGVGLGLSFCRANVDAHGGTIGLTSEIGRGTRVEVRLPMTANVPRAAVAVGA